VDVEVSLNGFDFTHDKVKYSYYDAFVLDFDPHIGPEEGGTDVSIKGFGFADTGDELLCRFGSTDKPLLCGGIKCEYKAKYISDSEVICKSPPLDSVVYKNGKKSVGTDWIPVEVSVHDHQFTSNHIKFRYFRTPDYTGIDPQFGTANGGTYLLANANFNWTDFGIN
jgi:hypothetical protein